jgi:hypothetical protein
VFEADWTEAFVSWKYFDNPAGRAIAAVASAPGQTAPRAAFGNIPLRIKVGAKVVAGAQAVDAMVGAELRRRGQFLALAQHTYGRMDAAGVALTYVFPSPEALAGFVAHLDYRLIGHVPRYAAVLDARRLARGGVIGGVQFAFLSYAAALARRPPTAHAEVKITARSPATFDERYDGLWERAATDLAIATVRDRAYLAWRYGRNPLRRYVMVQAERGADLAGWAVLAVDQAGFTGTLVEWLVGSGDGEAAEMLLAQTMAQARELGLAQLHTWMLPQHTFYTKQLRQAGWRHWPSRAAPGLFRRQTPMIVRLRSGAAPTPDPEQLSNWYLTPGDHDYY